MATRLEEAVKELRRAAGGRPFVLVIDPTQAKGTYSTKVSYTPGMPHYVAVGLLHAGIAAVEEIRQETTKSSTLTDSTDEDRKEADAVQSEEWKRDDMRLADLISLVIDMRHLSREGTMEVIESWSDEQARYCEEWALREHVGASDNNDVRRLDRPVFLPESWR